MMSDTMSRTDAEIEAAARALWDMLCPGIGGYENDRNYYCDLAKAALEAADRVRYAPRKPVTIEELEAIILNGEDDREVTINQDGSISDRSVS